LLGQLKRILDISDSEAGLKEEKLEGSVGGEGECGDKVEVLLVREIWSLEILSVKKLAKVILNRRVAIRRFKFTPPRKSPPPISETSHFPALNVNISKTVGVLRYV